MKATKAQRDLAASMLSLEWQKLNKETPLPDSVLVGLAASSGEERDKRWIELQQHGSFEALAKLYPATVDSLTQRGRARLPVGIESPPLPPEEQAKKINEMFDVVHRSDGRFSRVLYQLFSECNAMHSKERERVEFGLREIGAAVQSLRVKYDNR